jgi:hypothetical protein
MAGSRKIANVYAELSIKDSMSKGLKKARASLNSFGKGATIAAGVATAALTAAMAAGTKRALDLGGALSDVSAQTGINVASVMKLQRAYADGGIAISRMGGDVAKMQKAIVTASQGGNDPFASMGLSARDLLAMDPAAQFNAIGDAIMRITNPAERNAKAMEIFGKSGAKLMTVFGQFDNAAKDLGRMPEVAEKFAASFDRASDIIGNLPAKSDAFFVGFTSGIIGQLLPNLEKLNELDFTELGEKIGNSLSYALEIVTDGSIWEIFALQAEKYITGIQTSPAMNGLAATINSILDFGATGEWNFAKYAEAGIAANDEIISELDAKIQEILNKAKNRSEGKKQAAASESPAPFVPPPTAVSAIAEAVKMERDWQSSSYDVNAYQRRGLSLDGTSVAGAESKQETLLSQIRDILKVMERNPAQAVF